MVYYIVYYTDSMAPRLAVHPTETATECHSGSRDAHLKQRLEWFKMLYEAKSQETKVVQFTASAVVRVEAQRKCTAQTGEPSHELGTDAHDRQYF